MAPIGTFRINGGAGHTHYHTVLLNSAMNGARHMRFKNYGGSWSIWRTYASKRSWYLGATHGTKYVIAQYRDAAGNVRQFYDGILLSR